MTWSTITWTPRVEWVLLPVKKLSDADFKVYKDKTGDEIKEHSVFPMYRTLNVLWCTSLRLVPADTTFGVFQIEFRIPRSETFSSPPATNPGSIIIIFVGPPRGLLEIMPIPCTGFKCQVLHQPPWSFGFDSLIPTHTRGTREQRRALPVLKYRVPLRVPSPVFTGA